MAGKIVLNEGQLDSAYLGFQATLVLDSATRGLLDENIAGGNTTYDNQLYIYDSTFITYDGLAQWQSEATATLGQIDSSASAIVEKIANATSNLQGLSAQATEAIGNFISGVAELGDLNAFAIPTLTRFISAQSNLGGVSANATQSIDNPITANSDLGGLQAEATSALAVSISGEATLGSLSASATSTIPTPPTPEPAKYGSNGYARPRKKKKEVQTYFEPEIPVIKKTEPARPVIKTLTAKADTLAGIFDASAESQIDFSILEDEAELLLLI